LNGYAVKNWIRVNSKEDEGKNDCVVKVLSFLATQLEAMLLSKAVFTKSGRCHLHQLMLAMGQRQNTRLNQLYFHRHQPNNFF
jgi:hypothetical protein